MSEKVMASHSSVLAWRVPGMAEPGGLPSLGSHRVGHDLSDLAAAYIHVAIVSSLSHVRLCNPMDCSPPGFSIHGISQARILEWDAISFSRRSSQPKEPASPAWQADLLPLSHLGSPPLTLHMCIPQIYCQFGSTPQQQSDYHNRGTQFFWFPRAYESCVYNIL